VLATYTKQDPKAIEFERMDNGRPELRDSSFRFNLSHTDGMVLIGVTQTHDLGVDVERIEARRTATHDLARRVFTPREFDSWRAEDIATFFDRWTLKESYIKARGDGLRLDLQRFGFPTLGDSPAIESDFGDAAEWQFHSFAPSAEHRAAAAIRGGDGASITWRVTCLAR
jgi:4'-phosphopantetheinyl transferase